jgi:hypothetical protein
LTSLGTQTTLIACAALVTLVNVFVLMLPGVRTTENPAASPAVHAA